MEHSPIQIPPPAALGALPITVIADAIDQLIQALDERQGDPDLEPNGDEEDFGVVTWSRADPGYRLAEHRDADAALVGLEDDEDDDPPEDDDPGGGNITDEPHDEHDEGGPELSAWPERIDQTRFPGTPSGWHGASIHEDDEDDDADTGVEDDPRGFDPEEDIGIEDMRECAGEGDVCNDTRPIADPEEYRAHLRRIRSERCFRTYRREAFIGRNEEGRSVLQERRVPVGYRLFMVSPTPSKRSLLIRKRGVPQRPRA